MQFFQLKEHQYIIRLRKRYSWESFRNKAKVVPGTYSEVLVQRLYSSVFENSIDLEQEYKTYYKDEYENINQFMFWRYGVSDEIQKQLEHSTNEFLAIFNMDWQVEDDDILRVTFISLFQDTDE